MSASFYCDESGYTGTDWANPEQRIFVHGGWLILQDGKAAILSGVEQLRSRHGLRAPELKWRQLARRPDGAMIFREFFQLMLKNGALPFFQVADKDYITAAKCIETYFDPAYNRHLPMSFAADFTRKKHLAEVLMSAASVLADFAQMLRAGLAPGADAVRRLSLDMSQHFMSAGELEAAIVLRDFTDDEVALIQSEFTVAPWLRTTTGHTFWAVIQHLEGFLRAHDVGEVDIVHDNIVRFDELLDLIRGRFRESTGREVQVIDGRTLFLNTPTMTRLQLRDSKSEPFIQLSDLLCGHLRTMFATLKAGASLSPAEIACAVDLAVIQMEWETWDTNVPDDMLAAFADAAFARRLSGPPEC